MHVRADTASLHAACTSAGDAPDPLLLQTKCGVWAPRSDKETQVAVAIAMPATAASLNPYVVQRCRADRALDPDASWQTDSWRMPRIPWFNRRSNLVAPEPIVPKPPDSPRAVMHQKPPHLRNVPNNSWEKLDYYQETAAAQFNFLKDQYWTSPNCDQRIACTGLKDGHTIYMCYWKNGPKLLACYIFDTAFDRRGKTVMTRNPVNHITGKKVTGDFNVPRNSEDVIWFTEKPYGIDI